MSEGILLAPALVTCEGPGMPRRGRSLGEVNVIRDAALAWRDGVVTYAGPASGMPEDARQRSGPTPRVLRTEGTVVPGFVDCHTHLPFYGWRPEEFQARLEGQTYRDVQGGGGGIFRSARLLAGASDGEVLDFSRRLTDEMLAHGTTALELKTGYGLSVRGEIRQAGLARRLAEEIPQTATITLLACHAVPERLSKDEWVDAVCRDLIPAVVGLVDAVDVYIEDIAFTVDDLRRVADAAREHGLAVRCHADQLGHSGAAEAAVAAGARSADHLNHVGPEGVAALASAETTAAVLLPVSTLFLRADPPPAGDLVNAGAAVAIATDLNPGTSPCLSMPEVMAVAAALYRLPPLAALVAATANPAWVLGLHDRLGTLEPGKRADFVVLDAIDVAMISYRPGHNPVRETWIGGERVARAG